MKIYEKVIIDIGSGEILEEKSYEYQGEVAECLKTNVNVPAPPPPPPPSEEETELNKMNLGLLREMKAEREMMKPYLYKSAGLVQDPVTKGYRLATEDEKIALMGPQEKSLYENYGLMLGRQAKALRGELEVSPALEADIAKQKQDMEERMSRTLGTNWRNSTPGIQALSEFNKRADLLREEARRGEISGGTGLLLNQGGYLQGQEGSRMNTWSQLPYGGSNLLGYNIQAQQPYQFNRNMAYNTGLLGYQSDVGARMQSSANRMKLYGDLLGAGGQAGGMAAGAAIMACWVAREIYGEDNPKWLIFREWMWNDAPDWFRNIYLKYGEKFAKFIKNKPTLKRIIRYWMDKKVEELCQRVGKVLLVD